MAYETIKIGAAPNDGTGDPLRVAFAKINRVIADMNGGTGSFKVVDANVTAEAGQVLFCDTTDNPITITPPANPKLGDTVEIVVLSSGNDVLFDEKEIDNAASGKFTYVSSTFGWVRR